MGEIKEKRVTRQKDLLENLWEGNHGLAMTYWVYGVLGGFVWSVGIYALELKPENDLHQIVLFLLTCYYFVVYVGIWRAANKYQGNQVWGILAKFVVIIVVLPTVIYFLKWLMADYA